MNIIKKLQHNEKIHNQAWQQLDSAILEIMRKLLTSPKYQGVDRDGSFKNWINTHDMVSILDELRSKTSETKNDLYL